MGRRALASIILILICIVVFLFVLSYFSSKNEHEASHSISYRIDFYRCDKREEIAYQDGSKKRRRSNFLLFLLSFYRNIYMYLFDEHGEYKKEENKKTSNKFYI